jgi:hypothetical protein
MSHRTSSIYFIQADGIEPTLIKIGWTAGDPDERFRRLQATNAAALIPLGLMEGGKAIERGLHARFDALHDHGEWFRSDPLLLDWIADKTLAWRIPRLAFRRRAVAPPAKPTAREWAEANSLTHKGVTRTVAAWADMMRVSVWTGFVAQPSTYRAAVHQCNFRPNWV